MRVLFVDFDGVLKENGGAWWPSCLMQLDRIVEETGTKLVISSLHRWDRSVEQLQRLLGHAGLEYTDAVIDVTPTLGTTPGKTTIIPPRRHEIGAWLLGHPEVSQWCTIDDFDDAGPDNFVLIDGDEGLTERDADEVITRLNEETIT